MRYEIRARADEIQLLYRQSFPAVVASLVTGLLVCILLWPVQRHAILVGWFGALLLSTSARVVVFLRYWIMQPEGTTLLKWERPYRLTLLASAAIWGLGIPFVQPADSLLHQVATYFFLVGMAGGAVGVYSAHRQLMLATIGLLIVPEMTWMLFQGTLITTLMAIGSVLFLVTIYRTGKVLSSHMHQSFLLTHVLAGDRDEAERRARQDELTGLFNRRAFYEQAEEMLHCGRRKGHGISLILLDVDHFKRINDSHGHAAGDAVLKMIATTLQQHLRADDVCARIGGEEFAILLNIPNRNDAVRLAEKLCRHIATTVVAYGEKEHRVLLRFTASFGVATGHGHIDHLLREADAALYHAKETGRNRVVAGTRRGRVDG